MREAKEFCPAPQFTGRISILPPRSETVPVSEERNITRKPQAAGLEEGSRWFRTSDTTGLLSHNAAYPGGVAEMAPECSEGKNKVLIWIKLRRDLKKALKSWHPSGMRIFWLQDPVVR
jgi:hypothetical protein